jgi:hypothetical protein
MKKLIFLVVLLSLVGSGCATTKRMCYPIVNAFKPIHIEIGMTKDEVADQFAFSPEKMNLPGDKAIWIYRMGQGLSVANDKDAVCLGGYEWLFYFNDEYLIKHRRYDFR